MADATPDYVGQLSADGLWQWDGTAWRSTRVTVPSWFNLRTNGRATWSMLAGALVVGVLVDQALRVAVFGLAASAALVGGAMVLALAGRVSRWEPRLMLLAACVFAAGLSLRASPWLVWPDLVASALLLGIAASLAADGSIFEIGIAELAARSAHATAHIAAGTAFVIRPLAASRRRLSGLAPLARGLLIALPIVALVSILLASADPVFASFFNLSLDPAQLARDGAFIALGAAATAGLLRLARSEPIEPVTGPGWRLGSTEALVVLALLDTVFAGFALAQWLAASGAAAETLRSAGVTYSDYARSGFFQLLWVSGITLLVLIVFSRITGYRRRADAVAFLVLAEIAIALTLVIVAVAFMRLSLYEQAYGFTMLRLYSHIFAGWISVVFLLFAIDVLGARRRWFAGAVLTSALLVLLALNVANPEAIVVAFNIDHGRATHKLDTEYLTQLSSDGVPALVDALPRADPALEPQIKEAACAGARDYAPSLAALNWSDAAAAEARREGCAG
jgi:hypothetical protein